MRRVHLSDLQSSRRLAERETHLLESRALSRASHHRRGSLLGGCAKVKLEWNTYSATIQPSSEGGEGNVCTTLFPLFRADRPK